MRVRLVSMDTVKFGKWWIKPSSTSLGTICMVFFNSETNEGIVRYFTNEIEANLFTERLVYDSESEEPNSDTL